jgi:CheY-like chemotaxis protein
MRETQNRSTCILVDDDEDIRLTLTDQLLAMGYEVYQATNGREALDIILSRKTIDGMLMDVRMPVMDGWTMLAQLHQRHAHIPVIVMSADNPGETAPKAREFGAQGYLPKPFNFSHVQAACFRAFGERPPCSRLHNCVP